MWIDTVGASPVSALTCAASAIFSYGFRGVPGVENTLNRVPEFPYAPVGPGRTARGPPICTRRYRHPALVSRRVIDSFKTVIHLSLIHISEPTRRTPISYAVFCLN